MERWMSKQRPTIASSISSHTIVDSALVSYENLYNKVKWVKFTINRKQYLHCQNNSSSRFSKLTSMNFISLQQEKKKSFIIRNFKDVTNVQFLVYQTSFLVWNQLIQTTPITGPCLKFRYRAGQSEKLAVK